MRPDIPLRAAFFGSVGPEHAEGLHGSLLTEPSPGGKHPHRGKAHPEALEPATTGTTLYASSLARLMARGEVFCFVPRS